MASGRSEVLQDSNEGEMSGKELVAKNCDDSFEDGEVRDDVVDPEHLIKHYLQNSWSMWFFKNDKSKDWSTNLKFLASVATVEDFWALYNYIQPVSQIPPGCDYSLFKEGIRPEWEDDQNKAGGRWLLTIPKVQRHSDLDKIWLEVLLCLIGEAFDEYSDQVCGATVNIRPKQDKLGLWTGDVNHAASIKYTGTTLRLRLNIPAKLALGYQAHTDSASKSGSNARNRYTA